MLSKNILTIITTSVNPSGSAAKRYGSAERIRPKLDSKYETNNIKKIDCSPYHPLAFGNTL